VPGQHVGGDRVEFGGGLAGLRVLDDRLQRLGDDRACLGHRVDLGIGLLLDHRCVFTPHIR
jgi:hypothetical protein